MMTENEPLRPVSNLLLVRTPDLWWWAEDDDPINHLDLSIWAYHALVDAGVYRVAGVRDLDMESFAATRGVGTKIVGEVSLLRDVLRYRARAASPERAAFEANLPRNRIPLAWQTMLKDDRVESLGLSKRAREALAGAGAATAGDVLDLSLVELSGERAVGRSTLIELGDLFKVLHHRFSTCSTPREESLDAYFEDICPRPPAHRGNRAQAVLERYLGLHSGERRPLGVWPSLTAVAGDLSISISAVAYAVSKARRGWSHASRRRIRHDLQSLLEEQGGTIPAAETADRLLALRGSAASPEVRRRRALAVVRAGVEGEVADRRKAARFRARRRSGEVFVVGTHLTGPGR